MAAFVSPFAPDRFPVLPEIDGVRLAAAAAGVRYRDRLDAALIEIAPEASVAGVFTRSKTASAPILWCRTQLASVRAQPQTRPAPLAVMINAGNANAFTGAEGMRGVERTAAAVAETLGTRPERVFVASTGVIGERLPDERIRDKMDDLKGALSPAAWEPAARAIMTTDTYPKGAGVEITVDGASVKIAGVAKGSGMIAPDMATMLAFVFTDAAVAPAVLQQITADLCETTFNAVTVDGDTSTSDTLLVAATGRARAPRIMSADSPAAAALRAGLERVLRALAIEIARDGEGVSKFVTVRVSGAETDAAARVIGRAIANSPLVKTAWAGEDPNWGRLVMAVGKAGEAADRDRLAIRYGPHQVAEAGQAAPGYDEAAVAAYMRGAELELFVDVGVGSGEGVVWTCDLTHAYVSINADYRS